MNKVINSALAIAISGFAVSANANQFWLDFANTGPAISGDATDFEGVGANPVNPLCTSAVGCTTLKDQVDYSYDSSTVITLGADGQISVGDAIHTNGGLNYLANGGGSAFDVSLFSNNNAGFLPSGGDGGLTDNTNSISGSGGTTWGLSFTLDLVGSVASITGAGAGALPDDVTYSSGLIEVFAIVANSNNADGSIFLDAINIFDLTVTGSDFDNNDNLLVKGIVSFDTSALNAHTVDMAYRDFFNIAGASCAGGTSFYDIATCVPEMEVTFQIDQNLDNPQLLGVTLDDQGFPISALIGGDHNGSMDFAVPVPAPLFLIGGALLGLAGMGRRKLA